MDPRRLAIPRLLRPDRLRFAARSHRSYRLSSQVALRPQQYAPAFGGLARLHTSSAARQQPSSSSSAQENSNDTSSAVSFEFNAVGFIGLGAMGKPMLEHLANKLPSGSRIWAYDVVDEVLEQVCAAFPGRVIKAASPKEVAENAETILTMVPAGSHVREVYLDPHTGICSTNVANKLLIDCSTIDTTTNLEVKQHVAQHFPSASFYDAPVSGGVMGAIKGTLAIFLGCAEGDASFTRLSQLMGLVGTRIIPCGGPSLGLAAKLSNNYLFGVIGIASSEAFDMGMRSGVDPRILAKVFAAGTAQNAVCDKFCPVPNVDPNAPSSGGWKKGFKVQLMRKDFMLAVEMAEQVGAQNVLGEIGLATYDGATNDERCRDLDMSVVYRYLGGKEDWESGA